MKKCGRSPTWSSAAKLAAFYGRNVLEDLMKNNTVFVLACLLAAAPVCAQSNVNRPKILGIAHVAYYVTDLPKTLTYYKDFLGFAEPYDLKNDDGSVHIAFIKIDDHQHLELFVEAPKGDGMLNHFAFYTDNAEQMARYLNSRGVKAPEKVGKGKTGDKNFTVKDPDGHTVEFVEYQRDGWAMKGRGQDMPATRVSGHIMHTGFTVLSLEKSKEFYSGILGFKEFWRGSSDDVTLSWVNLQVPDGKDYVELMLYKDLPPQDKRGSANHISLMVPDIAKAVGTLESRAAAANYTRKIEIHVGHNRRRQANFFDPDGTRAELMEPVTIDGKPAPPSPAPPPRP
jgi:catechol 2,3-dioxygenase-like lactoylglutathione lyase family enzyme